MTWTKFNLTICVCMNYHGIMIVKHLPRLKHISLNRDQKWHISKCSTENIVHTITSSESHSFTLCKKEKKVSTKNVECMQSTFK